MATFRMMILLAFAVGLPAWAILTAPSMDAPTKTKEPEFVARPAINAHDRLPTASITAIEPADQTVAPAVHIDPAVAPVGKERFTAIQNRLKELGSSYILLETLGRGDVQYRFHCELSPLGDESSPQRFEATGRDPLAAMEVVLQQAEVWTSDRSRLAGREPPPLR